MKTDYAQVALEARKKVLSIIHKAQTSHIGSNLSLIDILSVLFSVADKKDRIVFSKGWAAASIYYFLAEQGHFPKSDLDNFPNSPYLGLSEDSVKGVETAGGSMGHGLPVGVGIALGMKRLGTRGHVYVVMSDGEMNCGTTWESAALASHHELDNLTVIVDKNGWQAMGRTKDVLNFDKLDKKWEAFGFDAVDIDGHNYEMIEKELNYPSLKPKCIIANTVKGKGISFMEDALLFHYKYVSDDEYKRAMEELCESRS